MQINVSGKQIDVGQALKDHVSNDLTNNIKKYFDNAVSAYVVFSKTRYLFNVDITVNDGVKDHAVIIAEGEAADVYAAYEDASIKLQKRLRRYKNKIRDHHRIERRHQHIDEIDLAANLTAISGHYEDNNNEDESQPIIIAENQEVLETLSVSDAVFRLEMGELPVFMFINERNNEVNVIYRRKDGNISWLNPSQEAKKKAS